VRAFTNDVLKRMFITTPGWYPFNPVGPVDQALCRLTRRMRSTLDDQVASPVREGACGSSWSSCLSDLGLPARTTPAKC
jgi:hypothetical protein